MPCGLKKEEEERNKTRKRCSCFLYKIVCNKNVTSIVNQAGCSDKAIDTQANSRQFKNYNNSILNAPFDYLRRIGFTVSGIS